MTTPQRDAVKVTRDNSGKLVFSPPPQGAPGASCSYTGTPSHVEANLLPTFTPSPELVNLVKQLQEALSRKFSQTLNYFK